MILLRLLFVALTQNLEGILHDMVTEIAGLQLQLQSKTQQLTRKEVELTRAGETIGRQQQQIQEMVSLMTCSRILCNNIMRVCVCVCVCCVCVCVRMPTCACVHVC